MDLVLTSDMVSRINRFFVASNVARARLCAELDGNPMGARVETFGDAVAIRYHAGGPMHNNQAFGLETEGLTHLDDILRFYRDDGLRGSIQLNTLSIEPETARSLAERQVFATGFISSQYGRPIPQFETPTGVTVRRVTGDSLDQCLNVLVDGFGMPPEQREETLLTGKLESNQPGARLYLACIEGVPAAAAALDIRDGIGFLVAGSTLPQFRNRGCQTALIRHRLAEAAEAGCDIVVGNAAPYSSSRHNMERAGMSTAVLGLLLTDCRQAEEAVTIV